MPPRPTPMALSMTGGPGGPTPVFATHGEAEAAFKHMLGQLGVNASWTWEMVMKEAITEPYYLDEQRAKEKEEMDKSIAKCRDKWNRAMDRIGGGVLMEDGVKSWWSFERGRKVMQAKCPDVWKMPRNDEERKILFHDFINKLRHDEEVSQPAGRASLLCGQVLCSRADCNPDAVLRFASARCAVATWTS